MNAHQFIREKKIDHARWILDCASKISPCRSYFVGIESFSAIDASHQYNDCISLIQLQRVIESLDIIDAMGDLAFAQTHVELNTLPHTIVLNGEKVSLNRIINAISDYKMVYD